MTYTAALAGNPNCGKTTLFNALTGMNYQVGNWPGVTVEKREAVCRFGGDEAYLVDLPGLYSMNPYSLEERVARDYLGAGECDVVLCVADAGCPQRSLYLVLQLLEAGHAVVVAMNRMDVLDGAERIDLARLSRELGAEVVPVSARRGEGLEELRRAVAAAARKANEGVSFSARGTFDERAAARYDRIERMLQAAKFPLHSREDARSEAIDRVLMRPYAALPAFLLAVAALFFVTFGPPGAAARGWMERVIAVACAGAEGLLPASTPAWARSLLTEGVLAGVGGVLGFLPQILTLFLGMSLLEESGCMARMAFLTDRPLRALGLSGRSFIPMLMGFGCTATAVLAARGVENHRDRVLTVLLLPFLSCGARLPVYALFATAFFPRGGGIMVLLLYLLGVLAMLLCGALLRRFGFREGESVFLMELPSYRLPTLRSVARNLGQRTEEFLRRAGTVIFSVSVAVWVLRYFTPSLGVAEALGDSMLGRFGALLAPLFAPLGFGDAPRCVALLTGLAAKEAILSTLQVACGAPTAQALSGALPGWFDRPSAMAFLTFVLLYSPCASALAAMRREIGGRMLLLSAVLQTAAAWGIAWMVRGVFLLV